MPGAASLVGLSALRSGAGVVHTTSAKAVEFTPELIEANFSTSDLSDFKGIIVGPGLGTDDAMAKLVEHVLGQRKRTPIIVDADALTIIAVSKALDLLSDTIITPHPGEAARLLGITAAEVQRDRYTAVRELAERTKSIVVLKGASTIIYAAGRGLVNTTGTPWMSTAGSGDVLAGIIGALALQGLSRFDAAVAGVALHGVAGQMGSSVDHPIIASDIIASIPAGWDAVFSG
jgi:NAD(P)H-hydrate epimerase